MILGLPEQVLVRRAWLAMLGVPGSALLAGYAAFQMVGKVLTPSWSGGSATDPELIHWAVALTVLVPFVVYLTGSWLAEVWRKRYAPRCPACQFEFTTRAEQVVQTRCCCHCGVSVDDPTAEEPAVMGLTRVELGRRLKRINEQFAKALGYTFLPLSLVGIWLWIPVILPDSPWQVTESQLFWWMGVGLGTSALILRWELQKHRRLSRTLGLECPACASSLAFAVPHVTATGTCPKCQHVILRS